MHILMNSKLSNQIQDCLREFIPGEGERLCCDLESVSSSAVEGTLAAIFQDWGRDLLLVLTNRGSKADSIVADLQKVRQTIRECLAREETISIVDLLSMSGATIDANKTDKDDFVSMTIAAWGEHEDLISKVGQQHETQVFRGN